MRNSSKAKATIPVADGTPAAKEKKRRPTTNKREPAAAQAAVSVHAPTSAIVRHRLLDRLGTSPRPRLIVIQAPAGYGKTSLLRQHCERRTLFKEKVAWVRMDAQSGDAAYFLSLLCDAVEALTSKRSRKSKILLERPTTLQDLLRSLHQIAEPVVLVVDNFETAVKPEFEAMFAQLVRNLPESVQLCVGTRVLPTARLARLQIREGTLIVSNEDLRFRPSETLEFFSEFNSLKPAEIAQIHERTDGWPAALQAFRLSLRRGAKFRAEAWAGKGVSRELMDFLAAEMFDNLAPALANLLLELAIPEKLSPQLVEHITGESHGAERLSEIERAGLFLAQADLEGTWLRFHNLFRHFLLARARRTYNLEDIERRHQRIADWYLNHGMPEEAIAHLIEANDTDHAADIMATIIDVMVAQERLGLIETYANRLSPDSLLRHDNLVRGAVVAYGFRRAFDKAELLLDRQRKMLDAASANVDAIGMHNFSRLFVLAGQDRIEDLGTVAMESGTQMLDHSGSSFGITLNGRAMLCLGRGEYAEARDLMLQALPLHDRGESLFGKAYRTAILSMSLSGQGRIGDAVRVLEDARQETEQRSFSSISAGAVIAAYLASNLYEQGREDEAEHLILDYTPLVDQQTIVDAVAAMGITRARIAHNAGRSGESEEIIERILYLGYKHTLERLVIYAHAELARMATLDGELGKAELLLQKLPVELRSESCKSLMFYAGETEACNITWARWLIHSERHQEAQQLLATEIRHACLAHRRRRELKLHLMQALAFSAAGKANLAGRSLLEALDIGANGGFIRSFIDERGPAINLMKQFKAQQSNTPKVRQPDPVMAYLDCLLQAAGEGAGMPSPTPGRESVNESIALLESLTKSERNLLHFVSLGLSHRELADRLSVSINTVKWHLRNIFEKLRVNNRLQAVILARQNGFIE